MRWLRIGLNDSYLQLVHAQLKESKGINNCAGIYQMLEYAYLGKRIAIVFAPDLCLIDADILKMGKMQMRQTDGLWRAMNEPPCASNRLQPQRC